MQFDVVIPARHGSQRLPGKPLATLCGKALILHVCERAQESGADRVIVATDDARIRDVCQAAGVDVEMTRTDHGSGTDRIAEVSERLRWGDGRIVINLQGDEPLMPGRVIRQVAELLDQHPTAQLATLCTPIVTLNEFLNPNVVKVVTDGKGRALYFSRAPIPWNREGAPAGLISQQTWQGALRHIGLYAYRAAALQQLSVTPACELEQIEKLEQLRALWMGMQIALDTATEIPGPSVDTAEDLTRVAELMRSPT
ncbi:MAG TPA: 3-deoxy-manno-octulosonate cytidylyltransferase [Gammaproteobacteria bacterium]|jgi:3-deoxy-manno-octulosonate cytidylyltransferase (CMP-KDO synthetase)|nr:3-deoxy-manno-octulosonate cytidylyltransferase [Gammaproteobacteria bacterium]